MPVIAKLLPLVALGALFLGLAMPASARPVAPVPEAASATTVGWDHRWHRGHYWDDPPRHWRHHRHWGPPAHVYRPPPRVWYPPPGYYHPPPRYYRPPPPPPAYGFHFRF